MARIASSVKRGKGSEQAIGEMPMSSGREISLRVSFLGSWTKARCFSGSKVADLVAGLDLSSSLMMGLNFKLARGEGFVEMTSAMSAFGVKLECLDGRDFGISWVWMNMILFTIMMVLMLQSAQCRYSFVRAY